LTAFPRATESRARDGRPLPEVPPPLPPADPVAAIDEEHSALGLTIHARTSCARWLGEPLDVGWGIDVLRPGANPLTKRPARESAVPGPGPD